MNKYRGLYIHIPFCSAICHYCDFAKTANFAKEQALQYLDVLTREVVLLKKSGLISRTGLESVFFGGGTPGLFSLEYRNLLDELRPLLAQNCELSIEVNPDDVNDHSCQSWYALGFNRVSMGVQTFREKGLEQLTRTHTGNQAVSAIKTLKSHFSNVNVDLIYGWAGQNFAEWQADLEQVIGLKVPHLSCYNLIYETGTTLNRKKERNLIKDHSDDDHATFYDLARAVLAQGDYQHEEVSNWSQSGYSCRHNWLYWNSEKFLALGAGAVGLLELPDGSMERFFMPRSFRKYTKNSVLHHQKCRDFSRYVRKQAEHRESLSNTMRLTEYIAGRLRTQAGIDLEVAQNVAASNYWASESIKKALYDGQLVQEADVIRLDEKEWFRENYWVLELLSCFTDAK